MVKLWKFPAAQKCIYCGALKYSDAREKLGDEHIVPAGLGGIWLLPEASCQKCERKTGRIEQKVLRGGLRAPRIIRGIGRLKQVPESFPLYNVEMDDGSFHDKIDVMLEGIITMPVLPEFWPPEILSRTNNNTLYRKLWVGKCHGNNNDNKFVDIRKGIKNSMQRGIVLQYFYQMLAKIGHAAAVAQFGDNVTPLLVHYILGDPTNNPMFIGGYYHLGDDYISNIISISVPPDSYVVTIAYRWVQVLDVWYLTYIVRLFANECGPSYQIVAAKADKPIKPQFEPSIK